MNIILKSEACERYDSLDGLRAYAMICIVIMHIRAFLPYTKVGVISYFSSFVALFMMVSAFSMCCGYYERVKKGTIQPSQFYGRRYLRILPYFVFLCLLDITIHPSTFALYELFANITLCFGLLPNPDMDMMGLGWFLGVIFLFYLLFPFYVFLIDNKRRSWFSLLFSFIFAIISIAYFYKPPFVEGKAALSTHNIIYFMPYFVGGGIIYLYRENLYSFGKSHKNLVVTMTMLLSIMFFTVLSSTNTKNEYLLFILTYIIFSVWLLYAISTNNMFLNNGVTRFLSKISMEMYLAQMVVFRGVQYVHPEKYIQNDTVLFVVVSLLTLALLVPFTYITKYYFVDKIADKFLKNKV